MKKIALFLNVTFALLLVLGESAVGYGYSRPPAKTQMLLDWQRAKSYTKEYLEAMPESSLNFKPAPEMRSFAEQMLHLANANFNFAAAASNNTNPYQGQNLEKSTDYKTKAALAKVVQESYDFVINALNGATTAQLNESVKLFNMDVTRELAYAKAFEHQTHHRGQTTVYLRLKGVIPPGEKLF